MLRRWGIGIVSGQCIHSIPEMRYMRDAMCDFCIFPKSWLAQFVIYAPDSSLVVCGMQTAMVVVFTLVSPIQLSPSFHAQNRKAHGKAAEQEATHALCLVF